VAVWQARTLVSYERSSISGGQEVVVATRNAAGGFVSTVVATTSRKEPLDSLLHVVGGTLWVDWRHAEDAYAWIVFDGTAWSLPHIVAWDDHSWAGVEQARQFIKHQALGD
jgi:hypothetical protein